MKRYVDMYIDKLTFFELINHMALWQDIGILKLLEEQLKNVKELNWTSTNIGSINEDLLVLKWQNFNHTCTNELRIYH